MLKKVRNIPGCVPLEQNLPGGGKKYKPHEQSQDPRNR